MQENIITQYGKVLRKGSIKTIVDLNESLKIDFNFQLHSINDLVTEFEGIMSPNRISHYVMAFIRNGSGKKTIGGHSFDIQPNSGLIFPKNVIHSTNKWGLDTSGYMLTSWTPPVTNKSEIEKLIREGEGYMKFIDSVVKDCYKDKTTNTLDSCKIAIDKLGLPPFLVIPVVDKAFKSHLD